MATSKQSVSLSATVKVTEVTLDSLKTASTLVGAPASAVLSFGNVGPSFKDDGSVDDSVGQFSVTFSWSEQR